MRVNVLFTSAGRRVELLRAFRRAYADLAISGSVVAVDIDPLAPALAEADRSYMVPRLSDPEYISVLSEICDREEVDLVFPLIDPDIPVLAVNRKRMEDGGARVMVLSEDAANVAGDKWLTHRLFSDLDVPCPATWLPQDLGNRMLQFPLFVKARKGSAGQHAVAIENGREFAFFIDSIPDPLIQEYLPGPEITSDVLCDFEGRVRSVVSRRRIEVRSGEVSKGKTIFDPVIARHCVAIAQGLEAVGPITIQCILRNDEPYFTEVNARLGGGVPLAIAAGALFPHWLLAFASGKKADIPPLGSYQTGLYMSRFDDSLIMTEEERARFERNRL